MRVLGEYERLFLPARQRTDSKGRAHPPMETGHSAVPSLSTKKPSLSAGGEISSSFGSCNTFNTGVSFSTGLFWKHLIAEGAYNETSTDGYIHGTSGRSGSYYFGLNGLGRNFIIRYHHIGNFENTGQAWNGVTAGNNDASLMDEGIKTYQDMYAHGLGRYNSLYEQIVFDTGSWSFPKDSKGNYRTQRYKMRDGSYWPQTTDNFWQNHNILSFTGRSGQHFSGNAALHYTYGYGYYEDFRYNNKLGKFGLSDPLISKTDFVRKKGLKQNSYGLVANINYSYSKYNAIGGISLQQFRGGISDFSVILRMPPLMPNTGRVTKITNIMIPMLPKTIIQYLQNSHINSETIFISTWTFNTGMWIISLTARTINFIKTKMAHFPIKL